MNSEIIKKEFRSFYCLYNLDIADLIIPVSNKRDFEFSKSLVKEL